MHARPIAMERALTTYRADSKDYSGPASAIVNALFVQFQHLPLVPAGTTSNDSERAWQHIIATRRASREERRASF